MKAQKADKENYMPLQTKLGNKKLLKKDKNLKRYGEAAAQAFLSTGPLVGGTATIGTINSEIKANYRAMKDPNDTRNAINNAKKGFDNAYKDGEISLDERNEFFERRRRSNMFFNCFYEQEPHFKD